MALSGSTLPQVSASNGSLSGTFHIVTTDGAGPVSAIVDSTGTGAFASGAKAAITTQVPGTKGNIAAPKQRRFIPRTLVKMGLLKRASNVNEDYVSFILNHNLIARVLIYKIACCSLNPRWHNLHRNCRRCIQRLHGQDCQR